MVCDTNVKSMSNIFRPMKFLNENCLNNLIPKIFWAYAGMESHVTARPPVNTHRECQSRRQSRLLQSVGNVTGPIPFRCPESGWAWGHRSPRPHAGRKEGGTNIHMHYLYMLKQTMASRVSAEISSYGKSTAEDANI